MIVPPPPPGSNRPQRATCNKCQKNCGAFLRLGPCGGVGCWPRLPEQNAERSSCGWLVWFVPKRVYVVKGLQAPPEERRPPILLSVLLLGPPPPLGPPFFFPHPFFRLFCKGQQSLMYDRMVLPPRAAHPPRFPELSSFAPVMCYVVIIVGRVMRCCVWLTVP